MPRKEKNNISWNKHLILFLTITGTLFPKKTSSDKPKENSLDFHLDMIDKIDKILAEHNLESQSTETFHTAPIIPATPPVPIEPRPSLNKTLSHPEITWEPVIESPRTIADTIPEEFKTELNINPDFRFITGREFIETISLTQPSSEDHIEIIDLNTFRADNKTSEKPLNIMNLEDQISETHIPFSKNKMLEEKHHYKKIKIIDARMLKQKIYEDAFNASTKQAEQIDNKAKLFFLNKKDSSDNKQKKSEFEQSYVPDDFEERFKKLKDKRFNAEEKQQQEEKMNKQLRQDPKFEEIVMKKTESHDKKQGFFHQEKEKPVDKHHAQPNRNGKDLEKEQMRLQRLEIRQARIEERLRKKREKHELKIKQKQEQLKQKEEQKQLKQKGEQKIEKNTFFNKEKTTQSLEFDEEIKKVLLMTDTLLEELPDDVLTDFMHSEDFKLYAKVLNKFKAK